MSKKKTDTDIFPEMTFIHYGDKDPTPEDIVEVYQNAVREKLRERFEKDVVKKVKRTLLYDPDAVTHESLGPLTQMALGGVLGGLGATAIASAVKGGKMPDSETMKKTLGFGIPLGALALGALPNMIGSAIGAREKNPLTSQIKYTMGNNAWKHYLIPGYAGYRKAVRERLAR